MKQTPVKHLSRLTVESFKQARKKPISIILDNIRSLHNVGAVFRTSDAFLIKKIYLCGITATPPHKEIQKTALGATDTVEWEHFDSTVEAIKKIKKEIIEIDIIAIEQTNTSVWLNEFSPLKKEMALIFGNEVFGIKQEVLDLCDMAIEIPQFGSKHSLNISVSSGIVIWDILIKLGLKPI